MLALISYRFSMMMFAKIFPKTYTYCTQNITGNTTINNFRVEGWVFVEKMTLWKVVKRIMIFQNKHGKYFKYYLSQPKILNWCKTDDLMMIRSYKVKLSFTHCVISVQIWSFFWSVFSCILTKQISVFGHFSCSDTFTRFLSKTSRCKC